MNAVLRWRIGATCAILLGLSGCGEAVYDTIKLMPPPAVYVAGEVDPFPRVDEDNFAAQSVLFYATDRRPATPEDKPQHYANERGFYLRGGSVTVQADPPFSGWEEIRSVSLSTQKSPRRLLRINRVDEFGVLPVTESQFVPEVAGSESTANAGRKFASAINAKLSASPQQDIFLYVHGYNVDFDYPILSSKELQHYMGYRGAFVTYAWPATPNRLAYFKDLETADATRKNLRELIMYLSRNTQAENIHIIGYSAGSRLAFEAVYDLTLQYSGRSDGPRLGQVILIGSDLDRSYFLQALDDGVLEAVDRMTIYMSSTDAALRVSSIVLGQERLGQVYLSNENPTATEIESRLRATGDLNLIDVSAAEGSSFGNGHSYFRSSPWASSDMFVSLIYDLDAQTRGLMRLNDSAVWTFPPDYPDRIVDAVRSSAP
ncbi:MAG: alpha/beta hydrolase [Pseudomonadota bacterium]